MTAFAAIVLLANALFALVAWPAFLRRVARDPRSRTAEGRPTRFLIVHRVLVVVALVLAALAVAAAIGLIVGG